MVNLFVLAVYTLALITVPLLVGAMVPPRPGMENMDCCVQWLDGLIVLALSAIVTIIARGIAEGFVECIEDRFDCLRFRF
jgi:amino acid transporter